MLLNDEKTTILYIDLSCRYNIVVPYALLGKGGAA
jgi:hypothetical protein